MGTIKDANRRVILWGYVFDKRTALALLLANRRLGYDSLTIAQGSWSNATASAGTHSKGGAVDLAPAFYADKVRVLSRIGFAVWHRNAIPGLWGEHIHAVLIGDPLASDQAKEQWIDYAEGRDGLADGAPDTVKHPRNRRFHYWATRLAHPGLARQVDALPRYRDSTVGKTNG